MVWNNVGEINAVGGLEVLVERTVAGGGCMCGAVRFRAEGDTLFRGYCHCADCRRASGAPVMAFVAYRTGDVEWTGEARVYRSSPGVSRTFCEECGTSLTYEDERLHGEVYIAVGAFDEPEKFAPEVHGYFSRRLSWLDIRDELPRHESSSKPR